MSETKPRSYVNSYSPSSQVVLIGKNKWKWEGKGSQTQIQTQGQTQTQGHGHTGTDTDRDRGTYCRNNTIIVASTYPTRGDLGLLLPLQDHHPNGNGNTKANSQYSLENFTKLNEELAATKLRGSNSHSEIG